MVVGGRIWDASLQLGKGSLGSWWVRLLPEEVPKLF